MKIYPLLFNINILCYINKDLFNLKLDNILKIITFHLYEYIMIKPVSSNDH